MRGRCVRPAVVVTSMPWNVRGSWPVGFCMCQCACGPMLVSKDLPAQHANVSLGSCLRGTPLMTNGVQQRAHTQASTIPLYSLSRLQEGLRSPSLVILPEPRGMGLQVLDPSGQSPSVLDPTLCLQACSDLPKSSSSCMCVHRHVHNPCHSCSLPAGLASCGSLGETDRGQP